MPAPTGIRRGRGFQNLVVPAASLPGFDPATLGPTGWWRNFSAAPWVGTPGGNFAAGTAPTAGTLNSNGIADFDGTNDVLNNAGLLGDFVTATDGTVWCLFYLDAYGAGAIYEHAAFFSTQAIGYFSFCTTPTGIAGMVFDGQRGRRVMVCSDRPCRWRRPVCGSPDGPCPWRSPVPGRVNCRPRDARLRPVGR